MWARDKMPIPLPSSVRNPGDPPTPPPSQVTHNTQVTPCPLEGDRTPSKNSLPVWVICSLQVFPAHLWVKHSSQAIPCPFEGTYSPQVIQHLFNTLKKKEACIPSYH